MKQMRIAEYKNGLITYRDATPEEITETEKLNHEIPPEEPSQIDRIEAQTLYTALMTDTMI